MAYFVLLCLQTLNINFLSFILSFFLRKQVIRALLECCITDSDRLSTLRDASSLLSSTSCSTTPCFPPLEIRYLITSAWNRGATHSKFARMEEAEAFMGVAVHMLLSCCGVGDEGEQLGLTAHDKVCFDSK